MILICIYYLMAIDVEHFITCVFAMCISLLVLHILYVFCPFSNWVVCLCFESCLYIVDVNPLSVQWFADILSQCVACFFIFCIGLLQNKSLKFWWNQIHPHFSFMDWVFDISKTFNKSYVLKISPVFFQNFSFMFYI